MLRLMIVVFFSVFFIFGCEKQKCTEYTLYPFSEELSTYFDNYKLGDSIIFRSRTKMDTFRFVKIQLDTGRRVPSECTLSNGKDAFFTSKYFYLGKLCSFSQTTSYSATCYIKDSLQMVRGETFFNLFYIAEEKTFKVLNESSINKVKVIDSLTINNTTFKKVLKVEVLDYLPLHMSVFFAHQKGIIRWENQTDTFNIKM